MCPFIRFLFCKQNFRWKHVLLLILVRAVGRKVLFSESMTEIKRKWFETLMPLSYKSQCEITSDPNCALPSSLPTDSCYYVTAFPSKQCFIVKYTLHSPFKFDLVVISMYFTHLKIHGAAPPQSSSKHVLYGQLLTGDPSKLQNLQDTFGLVVQISIFFYSVSLLPLTFTRCLFQTCILCKYFYKRLCYAVCSSAACTQQLKGGGVFES